MISEDAKNQRFVKRKGELPYFVDNVSVVFLDLVDFSSLKKTKDMESKVSMLTNSLKGVLDPHFYWDEECPPPDRPNKVIVIPTGDGYAIAFHQSVGRLKILELLDQIYHDAVHQSELVLRFGISKGPHVAFIDLNDTLNILGTGIIRAQRAMMLAAPKQVLCTAEFAEDILDEVGANKLEKLGGDWRVKGESSFRLYNYTSSFGVKQRPIGVKAMPDKKYQSKTR